MRWPLFVVTTTTTTTATTTEATLSRSPSEKKPTNGSRGGTNDDFESWFTSRPGTYLIPNVRHGCFRTTGPRIITSSNRSSRSSRNHCTRSVDSTSTTATTNARKGTDDDDEDFGDDAVRGLGWSGPAPQGHGTIVDGMFNVWSKIFTTKAMMTGTTIAHVPSAIVLSAPFTMGINTRCDDTNVDQHNDWDVTLSLRLLKEIQLGSESVVSGYCSFITNGCCGRTNDDTTTTDDNTTVTADPFTSVVPHSLRHWTNKQKDILRSSADGMHVLQLVQQQQDMWYEKYIKLVRTVDDDVDDDRAQQMVSSVGTNTSRIRCTTIPYEQFQWAMEVVHSRAFTGIQTNTDREGILLFLPSIVSPLVGAIISLCYYYQTFSGGGGGGMIGTSLPPLLVGEDSVVVWIFGVLLTVLGPIVSSELFRSTSTEPSSSAQRSAVLLPIIDSANHLVDVDSQIEYDPIRRCFTLTAGPSCFVGERAVPAETKNRKDVDTNITTDHQIYVSYGAKKDTELLLNYGFVPKYTTGRPPNDDHDFDDDLQKSTTTSMNNETHQPRAAHRKDTDDGDDDGTVWTKDDRIRYDMAQRFIARNKNRME
jgi:hypothetical protein